MPRNYIPKFTDPMSPLYDKERAEKWEESRKKGGSDSSDSDPQSQLPVPALEADSKGKLSAADVTAIVPDWRQEGCTIAEARFAAEFCSNGFDATKAYKVAVNASVKWNSAMHLASQMLNKKCVTSLISTYSKRFIGERLLQAQNKIMDVLWTQAFYDIGDLIEVDGTPKFSKWDEVPPSLRCAILSIKTKVYGKGANREVTEVKLVDRKQAIKALAEYMKLIEERRRKDEEHQDMPDEEEESSMKKIQKLFEDMQKKAQKAAKEKFDNAASAEAVEVPTVVPTTEV